MEVKSCPKCESTDRQRGKVYPRGVLWDIRFKAEESSPLAFKKEVTALACAKCGYIEFYISSKDQV